MLEYTVLRTFDTPDHTFSPGTRFTARPTGGGFYVITTTDGRTATLRLATHLAAGYVDIEKDKPERNPEVKAAKRRAMRG